MTAVVGVVVFPGTNCEHDVVRALESLGGRAELVWHRRSSLTGLDAVVLPGGFAHGDYLRPGAIARFSPVMAAVRDFAGAGGPTVGICNGFQVLTEAGLLPGALQRNRDLKFICATVPVRVESSRSVLSGLASPGEILRLPINHFEGNYTCSASALAELRAKGQVVLRYVASSRGANPNGSIDDIAGICNTAGNVVGLMPHPERACDPLSGELGGAVLLRSLLHAAGAGSLSRAGAVAQCSGA